MIQTARQLKDLIRNLSKKNAADAQILMHNYMMERLLERISLSTYRDKFILKGGMLVAALVGLDARSIAVWTYNLETVLAEKLETIITRATTNTHMRDFYDIAILLKLYGDTLNPKTLHDALLATARKRGTECHLSEAIEVFDEVENSPVMQELWAAYQRKFSYASNLNWGAVMAAVWQLHEYGSQCDLDAGNGKTKNGAQ